MHKYSRLRRERKTSRYVRNRWKLYHLSPDKGPLLSTLEPRIPDNYAVTHGYEDGKTPRVCMAPCISDCLSGIAGLTKHKLRVYACDYVPQGRYPSPEEVEDAHVTHEYWALEPVEVTYVGTIAVLGLKYVQVPIHVPRDMVLTEETAKEFLKTYRGPRAERLFWARSAGELHFSPDFYWQWVKDYQHG